MLLHLYHTELSLYEVGLLRRGELSDGPGFHRVDTFYACLHATKSWFDIFTNLGPDGYIGLSISTFTQLAHCIITLYRLSTVDDPAWNLILVREIADFSLILDQVINSMTGLKWVASPEFGESSQDDIITSTSQRLQRIKMWWDKKGDAGSRSGATPNHRYET